MLNNDRIKIMTHLAFYEENEGKRLIPIGNYFRSDYIGLQLLKAVICATLAFSVVLGVYVYYDMESLLTEVYKMDIISVARSIVTAYVGAVAAYMVIGYLVASYRYTRAKNSLKQYYSELKKLSSMYENESRK